MFYHFVSFFQHVQYFQISKIKKQLFDHKFWRSHLTQAATKLKIVRHGLKFDEILSNMVTFYQIWSKLLKFDQKLSNIDFIFLNISKSQNEFAI